MRTSLPVNSSGRGGNGSDAVMPAMAARSRAPAPEDDAMTAEDRLAAAREAFSGGSVRDLLILTRDGIQVKVSRADRWKFWRRDLDLSGELS